MKLRVHSAVHQPITFHWSLTWWFELATEELWLHLWRHFFTCTHVYKSLSNNSLLKIAELLIWLCAWRQGKSLSSIVDLVLEQSLVDDSSANSAYIYVVIADQQKAGKKGRDDSIKQFSIQPHLYIFTGERYVGWSCVLNCCTHTLFPCFCWPAIPTSCYTFSLE